MGRKHTEEYKKKMSELKKLQWQKFKSDPEKYKSVCDKIKKNHARPALGKTGAMAPGWKGGKFTTKRDGYIHVWCPNHPNARKNGKGDAGYVLEHRLVMEKFIGRYLYADEDVNHINGNKKDNRPENLRLVRHYAHYEIMRCPKCEFEFLTR